jgi:hypothetical protein
MQEEDEILADGNPRYQTLEELETGIGFIMASPVDSGVLEMIVRRPAVDRREILIEARLDETAGLCGDRWTGRASFAEGGIIDDSINRGRQLTLMNSRVISLLAQSTERWQLAGDQLFVDLNLSVSNLPAGARLKIGSAIIEITDHPHTGCSKFADRFGMDALNFVNDPARSDLRLRGVNAMVIQSGMIRKGDTVLKCK